MEGYSASAIHLLDVPSNVESSDWLLPSNRWPQWEIGGSCGTFGLPEKNSIVDSNSASEESFQGSASGPGSLRPFEGLPNKSLWQNSVPLDYMDFQLCNDLQADDLFL